jgi:hypothetical protein
MALGFRSLKQAQSEAAQEQAFRQSGHANAIVYATGWVQAMTNDKQTKLLDDVKVRRLSWNKQETMPGWTKETMQPFYRAWSNVGEAWSIHGHCQISQAGSLTAVARAIPMLSTVFLAELGSLKHYSEDAY